MEDNYFTMLYWFWFSSAQSSLWANSQEHDYWKNHSFGHADLCQRRDALLFNMLSRFVIVFLPRSKHLLISGLWSPSTMIWKPKKIKSTTVSTFPMSMCHEVIGVDAMILGFWMLSFKPTFFTLLFHQEAPSFFAFSHKCGIICISEVLDISPGNLDSNLCFIQPSISHDVLCI